MATRWQTLEEAALALGISSRTLHRRLSKGEFQTRLVNGRREVLVTVDDSVGLSDVSDQAEVRQQLSDFARRAAMLAEREQTMQGGGNRAPELGSFDGADFSVRLGRAAETDRVADARDLSAASGMPEGMSDLADTENEQPQVESAVLALHEDRIRRTDLAIMAYQQSVNVFANDTRRARLSARLAWGLAGCVLAGAFVAGIWITHTVTRAQAEVDRLHQVVRQLSDTADARSHEVESLRAQAQAADLASAKVEGELSATRQELLARQHLIDAGAASPGPTTTPALSDNRASAATHPSASQSDRLDSVMARITLR